MKLSDAVAKYLKSQGVEVIFGYQGGSITHMIDSFEKYGIHYVQNYNEQGSSLAADAYARIKTEGIGVAIGTNGPGATNMVTGIANAYCDSVPVLFLTGQVHTFAMKKTPKIRQESFQEVDILPMIKPITKYATVILDKENVLMEIKKAIQIAKEGRPGPVLIDLPVDIQGQDIEYIEPEIEDMCISMDISCDQIEKVLNLLYSAKRPLIIAGGGIRSSGGTDIFRSIVEKLEIPVVASLMGLDAVPHDDNNFVGFLGSYGNRYANIAIQSADVLLVLGSRLDMRQTGKRRDLFAKNAKIIHVDIDHMELGHFLKEHMSIEGNLADFLEKLNIAITKKDALDISEWREFIYRLKVQYPDTNEFGKEVRLNPNVVYKLFANAFPEDTIVCADVGQNQMWLAQSLRIKGRKCRILNSGGLGAMGYSLPAAIGAYYANPQTKVCAFMGDGGLQMNIQELQVIGSNKLPITVIVMNNHALGLIRDVHEKYYAQRYIGSVKGFSMPNLELISKAYGLHYRKISTAENILELKEVISGTEPILIEVEFIENTYVRPELLGNDGLDRQIPYRE